MTPCGVILLILDCFVRISMPNKLISQNVVQFDPFADSTISSANRQSDVTFNSTIASSSPSDEIGRRLKRHYRYNNFINSFVYQRIHGNHIPQCPCVINPGSNKCIAYDSRYQAASVEEAIVSFPDFTSESIYPAVPIDENTFLCRTLECQACARLMIDRLKKIGFLAWNAQLALNIPYGIDTRYCRRLRFSRPHRTFNPPSTISAAMRAVIREGKRRSGLLDGGDTPQQSQRGSFDPFATGTESHGSGGPFYQSQPQWRVGNGAQSYGFAQPSQTVALPLQVIQPIQVPHPQSSLLPSSSYPSGPSNFQQPEWVSDGSSFGIAPAFNTFQRSKRQAMGDRILGNRFVIDCIERGESESDDSDMLSLCGACWTWRQLPEDYFPRLINELVCKQGTDGYCLSGWGSCDQKFRNLDVLRRVRGEWTPTTISTASCCNCHVKAGTEIHALVVGKG